MSGARRGDPVRLAILVGSIAGLILIGIKATTDTGGAAARHLSSPVLGDKVAAVVARRRVPAVVRRKIAAPGSPGAAAIRVGGATYLLGGVRQPAGGVPVPTASVLRTLDGVTFT